MPTLYTSWEDVPAHRTIEVDVTYQIRSSGIVIEQVVPTRVVVHQATGDKVIRVHTPGGRKLLAGKIDEHALLGEIESQQEMLV